MRILMIHPNWKSYSEVWLHRMIDILEDEIVGVACFNPAEAFWNNKIPTFDLCRAHIYKRNWLFAKTDRLFKRRLLKGKNEFLTFVELIKPDRIFINFIEPAIYLAEYLDHLKIPVFIHVHGFDIAWDAKNELTSQKIHNAFYTKQVNNLINKSYFVRFIANSLYSKQQLRKVDIPDNKIFLKYFGVPIIITERTFNNDPLKVLFLGRFVDFKGPDIVLKAFIYACKRGFSGTLRMVGGGPLKKYCQELASYSKYSSRITFSEPVSSSEAYNLFLKHDIYTMHNCIGRTSNREEAFGVTIVEAMACGTPVITGASGGPQESVIHNYNGLLVEPFNVKQHANAFINLDSNREKLTYLSNNCLETVQNKFSETQEKENLINILLQCDYKLLSD